MYAVRQNQQATMRTDKEKDAGAQGNDKNEETENTCQQ